MPKIQKKSLYAVGLNPDLDEQITAFSDLCRIEWSDLLRVLFLLKLLDIEYGFDHVIEDGDLVFNLSEFEPNENGDFKRWFESVTGIAIAS